MRILTLVTVLGLVAGAGVPLYGQSLADVAKKEEDRRKRVQDSGKVFTNKDLKPVAPAPAAPAAASPSADAAGDAKASTAPATAEKTDEKTEAKGDAKDRAYWFGRMQGLREQLDRDRIFAEALQSRINALTADFAARDDPAQRSQIGAAREKALAELERLKISIDEGTKAIAALEEEARRAGVPPGWLR
jgi:hypothetical protein